ncbi:hypothetical protein I3J27_21400 [Bradyrhizobium xenonodulans]|uniref:Carboxypeptidase regulatory-like domain-containing protein n=1 Tax=Bradyrhizobium xenonodulans TaxID=2736875 RepID=A0ABY7MBD8_9BRAD|nr:hypothetical protein [Bradyrhizobium xenonodulans]WBL75592.1 hypothetical protein I3J27_21400 [Bradyrhizobium xenonodulans]
MTLARFDRTVTDNFGNVVSGASVTVRADIPGQPLVSLYSDRAGTTPLGNPVVTDANGDFGFYVAGGFYQIAVTHGADTKTQRYVGIGLAQGSDLMASGTTERVVTAAGTVTVTNDDADVILIKKTVGAATAVVLPDPSTTTKKVRIVDRKYDAATNNITITSAGTSKTIMGGAQYVIDSNGGSIELVPLDDGTGWV